MCRFPQPLLIPTRCDSVILCCTRIVKSARCLYKDQDATRKVLWEAWRAFAIVAGFPTYREAEASSWDGWMNGCGGCSHLHVPVHHCSLRVNPQVQTIPGARL